MRPALKPGLLPVWRDRNTLQIGIDPRRAVALTGMAGMAFVINLLDGSRDRAQVIQAAVACGVPERTMERVLALLAVAGALDDFPAGTLQLLSHPLRARLAGELATVSLAHRDSDGGARTLARRLAAQVRIHGNGRVAGTVAGLLKASGIGRVADVGNAQPGNAQPGTAQPGTAQPGTAQPGTAQPGTAQPGTAQPGTAQPGTAQPGKARRGAAGADKARPDLAVLVGRQPLEVRDSLMREQLPHLAASADEAIGIVGPLVIPGRTACLRCLDVTRADLDPAWPLILAQLAGREPEPLACDAPLAAAVAAQAAAQALAYIDRTVTAVAVTGATLELVLPGWQWRRRTWPRRRDCSCGSTTFR